MEKDIQRTIEPCRMRGDGNGRRNNATMVQTKCNAINLDLVCDEGMKKKGDVQLEAWPRRVWGL